MARMVHSGSTNGGMMADFEDTFVYLLSRQLIPSNSNTVKGMTV